MPAARGFGGQRRRDRGGSAQPLLHAHFSTAFERSPNGLRSDEGRCRGAGRALAARTVGFCVVPPRRRAFGASRPRGRGGWDEPVPARYFSFHSEAKDTPWGTRRDEFAVDDFHPASSSKGLRGSREAGMDGGRRGGHAALVSDRIRGAESSLELGKQSGVSVKIFRNISDAVGAASQAE